MVESFEEHHPRIDATAYVHPTAVVIGEVSVGRQVSLWPGVVLRGDEGSIVIEEESNIQDCSVAHNTGGLSTTYIGPRVTVGHRVLLHGCRVEGDALIGMGAILMDNCVIERHCIIGAGALVPPGKVIPSGSLAVGVHARVVRTLTDDDLEQIAHGHKTYLDLARRAGGGHG